LAIQSDGFAEMFKNDKNVSEMKIEDLSTEAVEEFLRFLYTGKLSNQTNNLTEVFALASRLKVSELKSLTEELIAANLDDKNVVKMFNLGHRYESETIKIAAFEEIQKMFPDKKLPNNIIENPEKLSSLVELKLKFENAFRELDE
jgi:BTB/POZ domain